MARYGLFVLKVPLNPNQATNASFPHTVLDCLMSLFSHISCDYPTKFSKQALGGRAPATICLAPLLPLWVPQSRPRLQSADRNVAVSSHDQYVPTITTAAVWRVNTAVSKAAWWPWPLTFWPWKWCPSQVWRGLPLWQFWSS